MNIIMVAVFIITVCTFMLAAFRDIGISMIFNPDAFLIVVGGTMIALFVGFPFDRIRSTLNEITASFSGQKDRDAVIRDIVDISRLHRKMDIKRLERRARNMEDSFLKLGVNLLINGHNSREIRDIMEREIMISAMNSNFSQNLLRTASRLTPSFGLAGTVISLIKMFRHFDSIGAMAPEMTMALMSTLYGVIIANLLMLPLCGKIRERAILKEAVMNITIDGIIAVKDMEHPLKIEDKLSGYREAEENSPQHAANPLFVAGDAGTVL